MGHRGSRVRSLYRRRLAPPIRIGRAIHAHQRAVHARTDGGRAPLSIGTGVLSKIIENRGQGATAHLARLALGNRKLHGAIQKGMQDVSGGRVEEVIVGEHTEQGYPLSFLMYDGTVIQAHALSQGLLVFFAFLCIVHRDDAPAVLLVEEPENGVHPLRLYEIVQLLRGLSERGVQIIMTTHSPDLLNACKQEEVLIFRRPNRDSGTEIHRVPADFERKAMRETLGEVWAAYGEEGLLGMLPKIEPDVAAEEWWAPRTSSCSAKASGTSAGRIPA